MTVYVLKGCTGEYSDYIEWTVRGFRTEAAAKDLCITLNERLKINGLHMEDAKCPLVFKWNAEDKSLASKTILELDNKFQLDYTGSEYRLETLEVE